MELLDTILDDHHTKKSEIDQSLINSMDTIAKYRLGPEKLEKIQAENKEKIERLQSKYFNSHVLTQKFSRQMVLFAKLSSTGQS